VTVYSYNIKLTPGNPRVVRPLNWYSYEIYRYAFHDTHKRTYGVAVNLTNSHFVRPRFTLYPPRASFFFGLVANGTMPQKEPLYRPIVRLRTERREDKTISALVVTSNVFIVSLSSLRFLRSRVRFYRD